jgi:4-amino-4-deoxy-L-arabinose transferase-like glycosyltransferase
MLSTGLQSVLVLIALLLSCFLAFTQYRVKNYRYTLVIILILAFTLRAYLSADLYLHEWDERYHALVAKNLMVSPLMPRLYPVALLNYSVQEWSSNYVWLHKQPVPLWLMAASLKVFGTNEMALRLPSVILSTGSVFLTYLIGKKLFNEEVGLLASFLHALNGLIIELTGGRIATDHIDICFLFFVQLCFLLSAQYRQKSNKFWLVFTGISLGLAVLSKWLPALIIIPCFAILNYKKDRALQTAADIAVILAFAMAIVAPWQVFCSIKYPAEYSAEMAHITRHFSEGLDKQTGGFLYHFGKAIIVVNELVWPAFIWACYLAVKRKDKSLLALIVWAIVPYLFFSFAATKMQAYLVFVAPALFIIIAYCWFELFTLLKNKKVNRYIGIAALSLVFIFALRYCVERIKPFQQVPRQKDWANEFKRIHNAGEDKNTVYFNVSHCIEGMFYTDAIMYGYIPAEVELKRIEKLGYKIVINNNPDL